MKEDKIQFISIPIGSIYPDEELPGNIFLFVGGHFIKYKKQGDSIPYEKYETLVLKKVQFVFIDMADQQNFTDWIKEIARSEKEYLVEQMGIDNEDLLEQHQEVKDTVLSFITHEITEESIKEIVDQTREFVNIIQSKGVAEKYTLKLMTYKQGILDHSVNVANLSIYLALNIGYGQQTLLETIYIGALLHDYGKVRINPKFLENPNTPSYATAMRKHPSLGKTALLLDSGFSDEVLRIIAEHHENHDGSGYPRGIKGHKIYDLTKIVSIANVFDNLVVQQTGPLSERQQKALDIISKDGGKMFDPKILKKSVRAIQFVT